uniref:Pericentriolar material 1 n=1 Tax=Leptobrachium leishanense TaxID=445787 RepID=A0A8C5LUT3_9ANUR
MATGGGPPEEVVDQDLPHWSHESFEDRLNNMDWSGQKKANRSSEKNKKKLGVDYETRFTNSISPESSPGVGRRRTRTPHTFPHTRYVSQMSVPEQAELERLKQKINFDLDQQSIGSDSQGRATAANNKRQLSDTRKPFNFLPLQLNTNKDKTSPSPPKRETSTSTSTLPKEFLSPTFKKEILPSYQAARDEVIEEQVIDSSQVVSRLVKIRDYITKASSLRDDLVEKNERCANVERLSDLIEHLKAQETSYLSFLQKMLGSEKEDDVRTIYSAVGSGSVAESTSLNIDVQSEASDATAVDPQREAKEELKNIKKQHALLTRMLQQQEQLRALKGRQAALLTLQHKAEQAIAVMDESVVTETTGSVSGVSLTSELNEELNDLIQRFHNQLHDSQSPPVPDNRRQAESLSLAREVAQSRNSSVSEPASEEHGPLFSKVGVLLEKKQKMDSLLGELHTLNDTQLNNTAFLASTGSPHRSTDQRSVVSASSVPLISENRGANGTSLTVAYPPVHTTSCNGSEDDEENQNPTEKLKKLQEVRKRLNELRDLVHYYEQTSDMMADAINENTNDDEESADSEYESDSEQEVTQPVTNIRNPQLISSWGQMNSNTNVQAGTKNRDERPLNTNCEINNRCTTNLRPFNVLSTLGMLYHNDCEDRDEELDEDVEEDQDSRASMSSASSVTEGQSSDFQEKFNRLIAAKQTLRQLQDLVAMYGDDTESETIAADRSGSDHLLAEAMNTIQEPNNTRQNSSTVQKDLAMKEQARDKFYESKLQQQQKELKQLQEERKKLIEIQEKIQTLQKACPDLQLSTSSAGTFPTNRQLPTTASTPDVDECSKAVIPTMPDPEDSSSVDNEVWSEIRRHQIVREDLRQRRKQLESLMAEQQKRHGLTDSASAASLRSEDSENQGYQQQSRTEKTMATWGGSTQCALDEDDDDDDDDAGLSDVNQVEDEEPEEEQEDTFQENATYLKNSKNQSAFSANRSTNGWKGQRPFSVDGNYRPSPKTRQQNISMRRQENLRWMSDLSHVEEKEHWQEQIDNLKKQLDFSMNICQTLMRDQQTLSYMLQSFLANPYNLMPSNVGSSQIQLLTHQLNQCHSQLNWQQNNVLRLRQMLNDVIRQQEHLQQDNQQQSDGGNSAPPSVFPNMFNNFSFLPPMNVFNMPPFGNYLNVNPGMNFNPMFSSGFGDFMQSAASQLGTPLQPPDQNTSAKTEYMAFPRSFNGNATNSTCKQRHTSPASGDGEQGRGIHVEDQTDIKGKKSTFLDAKNAACGTTVKQSESVQRAKQFDEQSVESLSSVPDPVDPTTVTKTFKTRKASAQASLASKDKTPKSKGKKRKISHQKTREAKNTGLLSASVSSAGEVKQSYSKHAQTEETAAGKLTLKMLSDLVSSKSPEAGSDFSLFEALRDTIYSEVATLISQNESRPHFLIELFHELQLLNTDYLRQKALFSLQDIVTRRIAETKLDTKTLESACLIASSAEYTPSQSLVTTDDETYEKSSDQICCCNEQNEGDNISNLSTSSNFEPFATDDLGNTVIHFDQALARIRAYDRMKLEAENNLSPDSCNKLNSAAANLEGPHDGTNVNAEQSGDEASAVPCPRIDTQQLDRQIKAIMKEVIPFLKEHIEEVCSPSLLTSIRRMVLTLTQQNDESKEFVKFFHKQLGSILQDSLAKFSNRKLKDCGEDLLLEISDVLFNELAFFRLMKDLDNNSSAVQDRCKRKSDTVGAFQAFSKEVYETENEPSPKAHESENLDASGVHSGMSDVSEEEDGNEDLPVSISLSKAETQALTNYGSGEDENEEEENDDFEAGPVDVQTSLEATFEITDEKEQNQPGLAQRLFTHKCIPAPKRFFLIFITDKDATYDCPLNDVGTITPLVLNNKKDDNTSAEISVRTKSPLASSDSSGVGSPATESPVLVNEYESGSGNQSQKSDEEDFVKVDNLPLKLNMPKSSLMKEVEKEEQQNNLFNEIVDGQANTTFELAGDALSLNDPGMILSNANYPLMSLFEVALLIAFLACHVCGNPFLPSHHCVLNIFFRVE